MEPSKDAIEAALSSYEGLFLSKKTCTAIAQAMYAIDFAALQREVERVKNINSAIAGRIDSAIENLGGFLAGRGLSGGATLENHYSEVCAYADRLQAENAALQQENERLKARTPCCATHGR